MASSNDNEQNFGETIQRKPRTYSKCDYIMLTGVCGKNCIRGRVRCGQHYDSQQVNTLCKNQCGRATKSLTQVCVKCGQCRAHQKNYHAARMAEKAVPAKLCETIENV